MNGRGFVLPATLALLVLVSVSTSSIWFLLHADLQAIGRGRAALQARYTAEAALLAASAAFPPRIEPLSRGYGYRLPGEEELVVFPGPPHGFRLSWLDESRREVGPDALGVVARAQAVAGASRTLAGVLMPARSPYAPAALLIEAGTLHRMDLDSAAGNELGTPKIIVVGDAVAGALAAEDVVAARRLESERPEDAVAVAQAVRVPLFLQDANRRPEARDRWEMGSFGRQARFLQGGVINGLRGEGLLVVAGDLRLEGSVDFFGVILVEGTLELASDSCVVRGFVQARALRVGAPCSFARDADAIGLADRLQALPRAVRLQAILNREAP